MKNKIKDAVIFTVMLLMIMLLPLSIVTFIWTDDPVFLKTFQTYLSFIGSLLLFEHIKKTFE